MKNLCNQYISNWISSLRIPLGSEFTDYCSGQGQKKAHDVVPETRKQGIFMLGDQFLSRLNYLFLELSFTFFFLALIFPLSQSHAQGEQVLTIADVEPGADIFLDTYTPDSFSSVAVIAHAGSKLQNGNHLIDEMIAQNWPISFVYAPEHGFRSKADAGAQVFDGKDQKTGLLVKSLYGKNKRPASADIRELDVLIFDLQDVGVRFYTYLSTLKYVLEAAALNDIPVIILDRPNPNGFYVDGPVLDTAFRSFVGALTVPIVHGMTLGEMASMIVGEHWIPQAQNVKLTVVKCRGYMHNKTYSPPVPPSPNLPTLRSILLYPHLCYFEATSCSVGRGTAQPFEVIAHPQWTSYDFSITPISRAGASKPKHQNTSCYGINLSQVPITELLAQTEINWSWWFDAGLAFNNQGDWIDRPAFLNLLMGTDQWQNMWGPNGMENWKQSYADPLEAFKGKRLRYLLYD
jgi:uncharacterized protein YbbC (DUF1343 family)